MDVGDSTDLVIILVSTGPSYIYNFLFQSLVNKVTFIFKVYLEFNLADYCQLRPLLRYFWVLPPKTSATLFLIKTLSDCDSAWNIDNKMASGSGGLTAPGGMEELLQTR